MPETEALLDRFRAAHTQVLGVSVDSVYSHANWGASLGGVSFPLLADFHPKGALAGSYGVYLEAAGIADRATVLVDSGGVVRFAESVGPGGRRKIGDLAAECERLDAQGSSATVDMPRRPSLPEGTVLYIRNGCGPSLAASNAHVNCHLRGRVALKNVSDDAAACAELERLAGKGQAPCLVIEGKAQWESKAIVEILAATVPC